MARDDKPVKLRVIDEATDAKPAVVRLSNAETKATQLDQNPIRLGGGNSAADAKLRLDLPSREEAELRTHQPDIDTLITDAMFNPDCVEQAWEASSARQNPIPWGWFVLIALILAIALTWSLMQVQDSEKQIIQVRKETQTILQDEEKENREAGKLVDRLDQAIRAYFTTTSAESLIQQVRHPERVAPLIRREYANKPVFEAGLRSIKWLQPLTFPNHENFWISKVSLSNDTIKSLIIEALPSGEIQIDWETLVCHQPMAWDDFVSQRPKGTPMDFRVIVNKDRFFSHEFANDTQWACFRLSALDSEEYLFGYVPAGGELARHIEQLILENRGNSTRLILRLSVPEGILSRRGVIIESMQSARWLYLESPESGS